MIANTRFTAGDLATCCFLHNGYVGEFYYTDLQYACSDSLFPTSPTFRLSFVSSPIMFGGQNSQKLLNQSKIFCLSGEPILVMDWRILLCSGVEQIWT